MTHNAERAARELCRDAYIGPCEDCCECWGGNSEPQKDMYDPEQADALRAEKVAAQFRKGVRPAAADQQLVLPDPRWVGLNPKEEE